VIQLGCLLLANSCRYIKELADRLNHLEGALSQQAAGEPLAYPAPTAEMRTSHEYSPPPQMDSQARKRTYSSISQDFNSPYPSQRQSGQWFETPQQPRSAYPQDHRPPLYPPNGLAPQPQWRDAPPETRLAFELGEEYAGQRVDWDDFIAEEYYRTIHPTLPLLPHSKQSMTARLSHVSPNIREAVLEALHATLRSASNSPEAPAIARVAAGLVNNAQLDSAGRSYSASLLLLQAMILLGVESVLRESKFEQKTTGQWVGAAVSIAYQLRLHTQGSVTAEDPDGDEQLGRRLWWSLVIVDRLFASASSCPALIPDSSAVLLTEDQKVLGEQTYHFARELSLLLMDLEVCLSC
jgi:hypothetical protein